MKKLITIVTFFLLTSTAMANNQVYQITSLNTDGKNISIMCIGGYQYAIVKIVNGSGGSISVAMTQMFESSNAMSALAPPVPIKCK